MLVVANKHLYNVNEVEEDGFILTVNGEIPVTKGNLVLHNEFGDTKIETKERLYDDFTSVTESKGKRRTKRSLKEMTEIAKAYQQGWGTFEDSQYINGTYDINKNN